MDGFGAGEDDMQSHASLSSQPQHSSQKLNPSDLLGDFGGSDLGDSIGQEPVERSHPANHSNGFHELDPFADNQLTQPIGNLDILIPGHQQHLENLNIMDKPANGPPLSPDDIAQFENTDTPSPNPIGDAFSPNPQTDTPSPIPITGGPSPDPDLQSPSAAAAPADVSDFPEPVLSPAPEPVTPSPVADQPVSPVEQASAVQTPPSPLPEMPVSPVQDAPAVPEAPSPVPEAPFPVTHDVPAEPEPDVAASMEQAPVPAAAATQQILDFIPQQVSVETRVSGEEEPLGNVPDQKSMAHSQEETTELEPSTKMAVEDTGAVAVEPPPQEIVESSAVTDNIGDKEGNTFNVADTKVEPVDPVQEQEAIPPSKRETSPPPADQPDSKSDAPAAPSPVTYIGPEVRPYPCVLDHFTPLEPVSPEEQLSSPAAHNDLLDGIQPTSPLSSDLVEPIPPETASPIQSIKERGPPSHVDLLNDSVSLPGQPDDSIAPVTAAALPEAVHVPPGTDKPLVAPAKPAEAKPPSKPGAKAAPAAKKPAAPTSARAATKSTPAASRGTASARAPAARTAAPARAPAAPKPAPKARVPAAAAPRAPRPAPTPKAPTTTTPRARPIPASSSMAAKPKNVTSKVGSRDYMQHQPGGGDKKILDSKLQVKAKSKVGSLDYASHTPGGGDKKIEDRKLNFSENAKSKAGTLQNLSHKPAGGDKKIESKKLEWKAESKVGSFQNATHKPAGGTVKKDGEDKDMGDVLVIADDAEGLSLQFFEEPVSTQKLEWKAQSKIGSLDNATHKPVGGDKKIESQKLDFKAKAHSKVGSMANATHKSVGGDKKIQSQKLNWKADSKIGSLEKATHKPGGGNVKIHTESVDFSKRAQSKVGSLANVEHTPGGGNVQIESRKLKIEAKSKIGSLDNANHVAGGGNVKIEDNKLDLSHSKSKIGSLENANHTPAGGDVQIFDEKLNYTAESKIGSLPSPPSGSDEPHDL